MTYTTEQERAEPIKMQSGDDLHLTMLMAPHGLNFVTGKDREQLLAWGRDVWQAARRAPVVSQRCDLCKNNGGYFYGRTGYEPCCVGSLAPQPPEAPLVPSIAVTPEMVEAANEAYCPFGDMELALCAALQVAPIPPGAAPVQLPENIREGEPYDNPAFEALARALGVWGTAQSVCAQFWIAAKEQST